MRLHRVLPFLFFTFLYLGLDLDSLLFLYYAGVVWVVSVVDLWRTRGEWAYPIELKRGGR